MGQASIHEKKKPHIQDQCWLETVYDPFVVRACDACSCRSMGETFFRDHGR